MHYIQADGKKTFVDPDSLGKTHTFPDPDWIGYGIPTKNEEERILLLAIDRLGPDSYTGTWLEEQLPHIRQAMREDVMPDTRALSMDEAKRVAAAIVSDAQQKAEAILADARKQATAITDSAWAEASNIRSGAQASIERAIYELNGAISRHM